MGFNADFLRDGLESLEGDDVRVKLISPLRPAVIQGEGDDFTYLVMPIRLPAEQPTADRRHVSLVNFRSYAKLELGLRSGPRARGRAERRREDEPARGAARRDAGLLAAHPQRRAADPLRRDARRGCGRGRAGTVPLEVELVVERRRKAREAERRSAARDRAAARARRRRSSSRPDRLGVVKGAPAARRAYFDRSLGRLVAGPAAALRRLRRRRVAAQRVSAPGRGGLLVA